ncbi:diphthine methyl ester synthase-like [Leptidea sinapis]|uniref:diphthine methyl ester synthase-like n=1 Tax=Leptidea sinapis TaxID=189913 RepID=UPI00213413C7|nr:diphthine methyl ester synthase-like [Leptidea sinapis]
MFYIVGLGSGFLKDITVKGLEIVKKCDKVLLEGYALTEGQENLEVFYGRPVIVVDRELCESNIDNILKEAIHTEVALLVYGDPLDATTHTDMLLRAKKLGVETKIIHNLSIMNRVSCCGLKFFDFGNIVSIPLWTETWKPSSFFYKIVDNFSRNLHSFCVLDIRADGCTEQMLVSEAASQLVQIIEAHQNSDITQSTLVVALSHVAADNKKIIARSLGEMQNYNGPTVQSLVIPAPILHPRERAYIRYYSS